MDKKDVLASRALLENGLSGWMNNLTDEEKRQADEFLNNPEEAESLYFGPGKLVRCPILVSRISRIIKKYGIKSIDPINELLWGILEDGKNSSTQFNLASDLVLSLNKKGGN